MSCFHPEGGGDSAQPLKYLDVAPFYPHAKARKPEPLNKTGPSSEKGLDNWNPATALVNSFTKDYTLDTN